MVVLVWWCVIVLFVASFSEARRLSLRSLSSSSGEDSWSGGFDDDHFGSKDDDVVEVAADHRVFPHPDCGRPGVCYLENLNAGTSIPLIEGGVLNTYFLKLELSQNRFTVRCDVVGSIDHSKFRFDDRVRDEHSAPYHLNGDTNGNANGSEYLDKSIGVKFFSFEAYMWGVVDENGSELPCFRQQFFLKAESCLFSFFC